MNDECVGCSDHPKGNCMKINYCDFYSSVHKPAPPSAGPVGSSDLLVAREGEQQRDATTQSAGPDGRPPCGECTNCEIMEQSKEISLLANEAVLDGHEPHKSTGYDPLEPNCGIQTSEQLCIEDCPKCSYCLGS